MSVAQALAERGLVPDAVVRLGIRRRLARQARSLALSPEELEHRERGLVESLAAGPITVSTDAANEQHYELPPAFFARVLGPHLKYSSAYWPDGVTSLADAEEAMLALYAERAGLADGMRVLDLGCGWGSFTLWLAARHPGSHVTALSNSSAQRRFIQRRADASGLRNVCVVTQDVADFEPAERFDRIVSIEMLEHVRNHRALFARLARALSSDGRLFVHVFTHRAATYTFEPRSADDWMARHFFTGGIMPADGLLPRQAADLDLLEHWRVDGTHYQRTAEAWLANMDRARHELLPILREVYGARTGVWWRRWRLFFMACAELWGFDAGSEWVVSHYLFAPRR